MNTRKIVINSSWGGFNISNLAYSFIAARKNWTTVENNNSNYWIADGEPVDINSLSRDDPHLVDAVLTLGEVASGPYSKLKIVEIPSDVDWIVQDYDGLEWVAERHRTWA